MRYVVTAVKQIEQFYVLFQSKLNRIVKLYTLFVCRYVFSKEWHTEPATMAVTEMRQVTRMCINLTWNGWHDITCWVHNCTIIVLSILCQL